MDTLTLFSSQPFYYPPASSPPPSSPPHETFVFVSSQSPPPPPGLGSPGSASPDDAQDPYAQDTDSTLTDGEDIDSDTATSTDGEDAGSDLADFVGAFDSSPPQVPSSLESAAFTASDENADDSDAGDAEYEQQLAETDPDGAWTGGSIKLEAAPASSGPISATAQHQNCIAAVEDDDDYAVVDLLLLRPDSPARTS
ncbi:hypothetical protein V8E36_009537 [Tilletia maclaganii]